MNINIRINNKLVSKRLHKLLAQNFLQNDDPEHKTQVNHKDRNKLNNSLDNLEWVTPSDNMKYNNLHPIKTKKINYPIFDYTDEKWKQLDDTLYYVSDYGRIKKHQRFLKGNGEVGYVRYHLCIGGVKKTILAHRLVMYVFQNFPLNDMSLVVNHINGNKLDNRLSNLQVVTKSDNMLKAYYETNTNSNVRPILQYNMKFKLIKEWPSAGAAARELGIRQNLITSACQREGSSHGFYWRYKD